MWVEEILYFLVGLSCGVLIGLVLTYKGFKTDRKKALMDKANEIINHDKESG